MVKIGSRVIVNETLNIGMGIVEEQLSYAGKEMVVENIEGYGVYLKGCDFFWKFSDIKEVA